MLKVHLASSRHSRPLLFTGKTESVEGAPSTYCLPVILLSHYSLRTLSFQAKPHLCLSLGYSFSQSLIHFPDIFSLLSECSNTLTLFFHELLIPYQSLVTTSLCCSLGLYKLVGNAFSTIPFPWSSSGL